MKNHISYQFLHILMICSILMIQLQAHESKKLPAQTIILLNGTSSAGKTTLIKELGTIFNNALVASIDEYTATHQFNSFFNSRYKNFYAMIHQKATLGYPMLVDTVLYQDLYDHYDAILQKNGVRLLKILVYCPLTTLIEHVQTRNSSGKSLEHRTFNQAFKAFLGLYTMQKTKHQIIDNLHSSAMQSAVQTSTKIVKTWSKKNQKRLRKTNKKIMQKFVKNRQHAIALRPTHHWDLVVNTSLDTPENIAAQIAEFIEKNR